MDKLGFTKLNSLCLSQVTIKTVKMYSVSLWLKNKKNS